MTPIGPVSIRRPRAALWTVLAALSACVVVGGCASTPPAPINSADTLGDWTIAEPPGSFGDGVELTNATLRVTAEGFDRVTTLRRQERLIEVGESGTWSVEGPTMELLPEWVMVIVTQPGDVSVETFEPETDGQAAARLTLVGDRLVLEMLEAGRPVGRIAYRRDR